MLKLDLPRLDLATNRNAAKSVHLALSSEMRSVWRDGRLVFTPKVTRTTRSKCRPCEVASPQVWISNWLFETPRP